MVGNVNKDEERRLPRMMEERERLTTDTGFSNENNNEFLYKSSVNAYIPDNRFRSRDSQIETQDEKYGKRK